MFVGVGELRSIENAAGSFPVFTSHRWTPQRASSEAGPAVRMSAARQREMRESALAIRVVIRPRSFEWTGEVYSGTSDWGSARAAAACNKTGDTRRNPPGVHVVVYTSSNGALASPLGKSTSTSSSDFGGRAYQSKTPAVRTYRPPADVPELVPLRSVGSSRLSPSPRRFRQRPPASRDSEVLPRAGTTASERCVVGPSFRDECV
jgi:hypothetical protein